MRPKEPGTEFATPGALAGRQFVLLQGPSSRFWAHLGRALRSRGGAVARVGFCPGDRLFWSESAGEYLPYRERVEDFGSWLKDLITARGTTDIIMLGDGRVPHAAAAELIRSQGLPLGLWIVEHGYLRPDLVLIEPNGTGGTSTIPELFPEAAVEGPAENLGEWGGSFARYALMDVAYHLSNLLFAPLRYPHYRPHSGIHPLVEYAGWLGKAVTIPWRRRQRQRTLSALDAQSDPVFLYPLQLNQDMQLANYGTGEPQLQTLMRVVHSFLAHADPATRLVVKVHPLDNGLANWRAALARFGPRVLFLDGGDLDRLLSRVAGVVTINSTVGLAALQAGVPTLALGDAVYKSAGLTDEQDLDGFWKQPNPPDRERVTRFCAFVRTRFHVPGAFDGPGAVVAASGLADWLSAQPSCIRAGVA
ncbi:MAG: hypothetical protein ACR2OY_02575 [Boseongicola sp.]